MEKVSLEDYKRKKGLLPEEDHGTIFVFTSDREGVSEVKELLIWEKRVSGVACYPEERKGVKRYGYRLKEAPYSVELYEDDVVSVSSGLASGIGDCWHGSTFASFNRGELEKRREQENERIREKYHKFGRFTVILNDMPRMEESQEPLEVQMAQLIPFAERLGLVWAVEHLKNNFGGS